VKNQNPFCQQENGRYNSQWSGRKLVSGALQIGQTQFSGISSKGVPGGIPFSGFPNLGS